MDMEAPLDGAEAVVTASRKAKSLSEDRLNQTVPDDRWRRNAVSVTGSLERSYTRHKIADSGSREAEKSKAVTVRKRITKLTEKGADYQMHRNLKKRKTTIDVIRKRIAFIEQAMRSYSNVSAVTEEIKRLDASTAEFIATNEKLEDLLDEETKENQITENRQIDEDIFLVKTTAMEWLKLSFKHEKLSKSTHTNSSKSSCSTKSRRTDVTRRSSQPGSHHSNRSFVNKIAEEEIRLQEMILESSLAEEKFKINAERLKIDAEELKLKIKAEQRKSEARVQVYKKYLNTGQNDATTIPDTTAVSTTLAVKDVQSNVNNVIITSSSEVRPLIKEVSTNPLNSYNEINNEVSTNQLNSYDVINKEVLTNRFNSYDVINSADLTSTNCLTYNDKFSAAAAVPVSMISTSYPETIERRTTPAVTVTSSLETYHKPSYLPPNQINQPSQHESSQETTYQVMCKLLQEQGAPDADLDVFDGNPLEYKFFMRSFEDVVERKIIEPRGRLTRLIKFTTGEAKELIKGCIHKDPKDGYIFAKQLLEKRFGDHHRILAEYRKQLREWKPLKSGDGAAYRKFYSFLLKCSCLVDGRLWSALDSTDNLRTILSKLPGATRDRWNRKVLHIRTKLREPDLNDLISFVDNENVLVNDPLYSRDALNDIVVNNPSQDSKYPGKIKTYNVNHHVTTCACCGKNHELDVCNTFNNKDLRDRIKIIMKSRLCFGCFSKSHIIKDCRYRKTCHKCNEKHPTSIHGFTPKKLEDRGKGLKSGTTNRRKTDSTNENPDNKILDVKKDDQKIESTKIDETKKIYSAASWSREKVISICVVPVLIRREDDVQEVLTHALLDSCSQGTFISDELLQNLNIEGVPTEITVKTLNGEQTDKSKLVTGLMVKSKLNSTWLKLPKTYSRQQISSSEEEVATFDKIKRWSYLNQLKDELCKNSDVKIGLLIGANCPAALEPQDVIKSQHNGPYAYKTKLGWCIVGPIDQLAADDSVGCNHVYTTSMTSTKPHILIKNEVQFKDVGIENMLQRLYDMDKVESSHLIKIVQEFNLDEISQDDLKFMMHVKDEVKKIDGHYVIPLPFRDANVTLPNNKWMAKKRADSLKRKFMRDDNFHNDYKDFINDMLSKEYAQPATETINDGNRWYIPHHGVYHPTKNKIRVVFDCSSEVDGNSLNKNLLQGPDLTNQLIGVLCRFRQEKIAIMGDIEAMYYQVKIPENHKKFVSFLWWPDGDITRNLKEYEMCVHIFGGTSSPGCSNFALKQAAKDGEENYGTAAKETLERNFYVDDLLKSVEDENTAVILVKDVTAMCKDGGFTLTKFISNNEVVLKSIDDNRRRKGVKDHDLSIGEKPMDQALGVHWNVEGDYLVFKITLKERPSTRRGLLSNLSSIYDPLGLAAPFLLKGKRILQTLCSNDIGWDDDIPFEIERQWTEWKSSLHHLEEIKIPRCFKPTCFGKTKEISLHHFSDASDEGYGQCSYLRLIDEFEVVHCALVTGKSRVVPTKNTPSIPRLELMAATLSAKVGHKLKKELQYPINYETYWTDSQVVMGYIKNHSKRYKVFVANRVTLINKLTNAEDWKYVQSKNNPADEASRGVNPKKWKNSSWFEGPKFLWKRELPSGKVNETQLNSKQVLNEIDNIFKVTFKETDINSVNPLTVCVKKPWYETLVEKVSRWQKLKRIVAYVMLFVRSFVRLVKAGRLKYSLKLRNKLNNTVSIDVSMLEEAEKFILLKIQKQFYPQELLNLQKSHPVKATSNIHKLDPIISTDGLIRVGGRLRRSTEEFKLKHPVIVPKTSNVATLIVRQCHNEVHHAGRGITMNEVRNHGYWISSLNSFVRSIIWNCVLCRMLRGKFQTQKMNDLPQDRITVAAPFTFCGVDLFGPFLIKERRSEVKRYGVIFTCLSCRAIHLETVNQLTTDSFILALRRFIARRGNVRIMRSDNGTNFVGTKKELAINDLDQVKITAFLNNKNTDWIWKRNPPYASHFGGIWERQINSARRIFEGLLLTHSKSLNDESFRTLLTEVEAIVNARPLNVETLSDPNSATPLSPSYLLTHKSKVVQPPVGMFSSADVFSKRYWRRVQHIANEFWIRWRKEYLSSLQERTKWITKKRNLTVGDVVIVDTDVARNEWPIGIIKKVYNDENNFVRKVDVRLSNGDVILRPISKIVVLVENGVETPPREP